MKIMINEYVDSDTAISYEDGKKCLEKILQYIDENDKLTLDFKGINYAITAFLNPIIGDLIILKGEDVMKKINIDNANENILEKIKIVGAGALLKREDLKED